MIYLFLMCAIVCQYNTTDVDAALPPAVIKQLSAISNHPGFIAQYNTWLGMETFVISGFPEIGHEKMVFGLTPVWADRKMYLFNARAEGKLNQDNDPNYAGIHGIFQMPSFRQAIRSHRCLIPVNAFVEGTEKEKLSKPYLIRRKDKKVFFLGGIWEEWIDKTSGEISKGFAIITTSAAPLLQKLPHHRSPLIINTDKLEKWLDSRTSKEDISKLLHPFDSSAYESFPISASIKSRENLPELLQPI